MILSGQYNEVQYRYQFKNKVTQSQLLKADKRRCAKIH